MPDLELLRKLAPPVEEPPPARFKVPRRRRPALLLTPVAVGIAVLALVLPQLGGNTRFAEAAIRAAEASPRLLVDGWEVTRVDEWSGGEGEMTFTRGGRTLELRWPPAPKKEMERVGEDVYRYRGGGNDFVGYVGGASVRGVAPSPEAFAEAVERVHRVSAEEWLEALPGSAVAPRAQAAEVDAMLRGVPLPHGFRPPAAEATTRDRYQLGAKVAGAVACAWIERGGEEARKALATAKTWPILHEMNAEGDYPEVLWQYADAFQKGADAPAGKPGVTVEESYRDALGC